MDRAEEFIRLFNQVEKFLSGLVNPGKHLKFWQLVDAASTNSSAVHANAAALKQFSNLRNAIVHDADYPLHIVAVPSPEALSKFAQVVHEVITPDPLIPQFEAQVYCFSSKDLLSGVLRFMRENDYSQVMVRGDDGKLHMITVESITKWLSDNIDTNQNPVDRVRLGSVIALEPSGSFRVMGSDKTIYDVADAFRNTFQCEGTKLYAIVITKNGDESEEPIGFVTPWDLARNHR
ncbi:MAG: hypothetical protein ABSE51_18385 [Terracidiphilus sp.]